MIQDIEPKHLYNTFVDEPDAVPMPTDTLFIFSGNHVVCRKETTGMVTFPSVQRAQEMGFDEHLFLYLFRIDSKQYFLFRNYDEGIAEDTSINPIPDFTWEDTQIMRRVFPLDECFAVMTAFHLYNWYRNNKFCGRCGHRTEYSHRERAKICPICGNVIYPRINPAVIVGVIEGDKILMTRYAGRAYKGHALIAGFTEIGESVEQTVQREVMEEVGLHVSNIRYYKSQPWGIESDLLMGFYCDADPAEIIHMDTSELARARFFGRDEITPEDGSRISLTGEMIMRFKNGEV